MTKTTSLLMHKRYAAAAPALEWQMLAAKTTRRCQLLVDFRGVVNRRSRRRRR